MNDLDRSDWDWNLFQEPIVKVNHLTLRFWVSVVLWKGWNVSINFVLVLIFMKDDSVYHGGDWI